MTTAHGDSRQFGGRGRSSAAASAASSSACSCSACGRRMSGEVIACSSSSIARRVAARSASESGRDRRPPAGHPRRRVPRRAARSVSARARATKLTSTGRWVDAERAVAEASEQRRGRPAAGRRRAAPASCGRNGERRAARRRVRRTARRDGRRAQRGLVLEQPRHDGAAEPHDPCPPRGVGAMACAAARRGRRRAGASRGVRRACSHSSSSTGHAPMIDHHRRDAAGGHERTLVGGGRCQRCGRRAGQQPGPPGDDAGGDRGEHPRRRCRLEGVVDERRPADPPAAPAGRAGRCRAATSVTSSCQCSVIVTPRSRTRGRLAGRCRGRGRRGGR